MRLERLSSEPRRLGTLLFVITSAQEMKSEKPQGDVTYYMLASTPKSLNSPEFDLHKDKNFLREFLKQINVKCRWKSLPLRGIILLQWSIMIWFARHHDEDLVEATNLPQGFTDEEVEKHVWGVFQSDMFKFLSNIVLMVRPQGSIDEADRSFTNLRFDLTSEAETNDMNINGEEFKFVLLEAFGSFITKFIKPMSSIIRWIKHRQEDIILTSSKTNRSI